MFGGSKDESTEDRSSLNRLSCDCGACAAEPPAAEAGDTWRVLAAEALGTALLVLLSCLGACAAPLAPPASLLQRALTGGLVVTVLVQCFDHVSGALLNPAVALAAALRGRVRRGLAAAACVAQAAGAVAGAGLLRLLPAAGAGIDRCLTLPADHVSVYEAVAIEALLGGCLALANCASWDARNRLLPDSWPARVGLVVAGLTLVAGDLTGASMNPARSFGPALWAANFDRHWVYWAGPLSGSLLCSALYSCVWRAPALAPARACPLPPRAARPRPLPPRPARPAACATRPV